MQKVIAKINLKNIRDNALYFKALSKTKLCAVVKANAYGHGAEEVTNVLQGIADCFAVALIDEGISIRTVACGKDVLVFTPPVTFDEAISLVENGFIATVSDIFTANLVVTACKKINRQAKVHLKVNTGMNRYGGDIQTIERLCRYFKNNSQVQVDGIYTHLYAYTPESVAEQKQLFEESIAVCKRYFPNLNAHLGGTYGAMLGEKFSFDMVRVGIGLYGYLPTGERDFHLKKAMRIYANTICNREYSFGGVGYGNSLSQEERKHIKELSVCRFGYADGFLRKKDNGVVNAKQNANNLCMDVCIRKNHAKRGALLPVMLDADQTAKETDTVSYEVLCSATRRAELIYEYE